MKDSQGETLVFFFKKGHDAQRPAPAVAALHLRMSGGKGCDKEEAHYTGKQPDDKSGVTSRDTAATENEGHFSGHT